MVLTWLPGSGLICRWWWRVPSDSGAAEPRSGRRPALPSPRPCRGTADRGRHYHSETKRRVNVPCIAHHLKINELMVGNEGVGNYLFMLSFTLLDFTKMTLSFLPFFSLPISPSSPSTRSASLFYLSINQLSILLCLLPLQRKTALPNITQPEWRPQWAPSSPWKPCSISTWRGTWLSA